MCKFLSKSGGVPFQPLGDLTWNDLFFYSHVHALSNLSYMLEYHFALEILKIQQLELML